MKVLLAAHTSALAGAERDLLELAQALDSRPDVEVEAVVPRRGPLLDALDDLGVRTSVVASRWWATNRAYVVRRAAYLAVNLVAFPRAVRFLRRRRPDLVVTFTVTMPVWGLAARRAGVAHVWLLREFGVEDHDFTFHFGRHRSMHLVDRLSALVAVPSKAVAERMAEWIPPSKLRVVRYASVQPGRVDPHTGDGGDEFALLLVGTLRHSKGQGDALEALAQVRASGVPARLTLVGTGRPEHVRALERAAQALGVAEATTFTGPVLDATPYYDRADVVLSCSRSEAYGRVVVEALKRGVPVIGSNAGGTVEQLTDSGGGLLYEPGDPAALADAIRRLHEDPELRRRLADDGQAWATATFSLERFADDFLAVAREALGTGDDRRAP
ncbi:MAG: glycosyltransferase family 1 protein [Acidimicrobiales bacterium]|nr:glycosyltransferase family 1 protein [Acidimicrobiales bacterium]